MSRIFLDLHDIGAGARWRRRSQGKRALRSRGVAASPASLASTECRFEIRMGLRQGDHRVADEDHLGKASTKGSMCGGEYASGVCSPAVIS